VIGYGAMGRNHARVLAGLAGVELAAIVRPSGAPGSAPAQAPTHASPSGTRLRIAGWDIIG
jgi:hypothetical protein